MHWKVPPVVHNALEVTHLFVHLLEELDLFLQRLPSVLRVHMQQRLIVKVLEGVSVLYEISKIEILN